MSDNAGILERQSINAITEESIDRHFSINLKGTIFTVQKAWPRLVDGGAIVLTGSTVAHKGLGSNSYRRLQSSEFVLANSIDRVARG